MPHLRASSISLKDFLVNFTVRSQSSLLSSVKVTSAALCQWIDHHRVYGLPWGMKPCWMHMRYDRCSSSIRVGGGAKYTSWKASSKGTAHYIGLEKSAHPTGILKRDYSYSKLVKNNVPLYLLTGSKHNFFRMLQKCLNFTFLFKSLL